MSKLPEKPSALIRLALADLEKLEKDSRYEINMDVWHIPANTHSIMLRDITKCSICLAGAVMAGTLGVSSDDNAIPDFFEEEAELSALDDFRNGFVGDGLEEMDLELPEGMEEDFEVTSYEDDPIKFKKDMFNLALTLEHFDL